MKFVKKKLAMKKRQKIVTHKREDRRQKEDKKLNVKLKNTSQDRLKINQRII